VKIIPILFYLRSETLLIETKVLVVLYRKPVIDDMTALVCQAIAKFIRLAILKVDQVIKLSMGDPLYMYAVRIFSKLREHIVDRHAVSRYGMNKIIEEAFVLRVRMDVLRSLRRQVETEPLSLIRDRHCSEFLLYCFTEISQQLLHLTNVAVRF
jgi:hypothetical protein